MIVHTHRVWLHLYHKFFGIFETIGWYMEGQRRKSENNIKERIKGTMEYKKINCVGQYQRFFYPSFFCLACIHICLFCLMQVNASYYVFFFSIKKHKRPSRIPCSILSTLHTRIYCDFIVHTKQYEISNCSLFFRFS